MKQLLTIGLIMSLSACSLFKPKEDGGSSAPAPRVREDFHACPDESFEQCAPYSGGGICVPSGEHHSVQDKCPFKK